MPLGEWDRRLGALPVEAYHCFMVWVPWTQPITSVWRGFRSHTRQAPLGSSVAIAGACRRVHVRQGQASGGAEEAPSLTAVARVGFGSLAVGAEENLRVEQKKGYKKGRKKEKVALRALDKKSPIQAVCGKSSTYGSWLGREVTRITTAKYFAVDFAIHEERLREGRPPPALDATPGRTGEGRSQSGGRRQSLYHHENKKGTTI